jgi:hypothetical protein
MNDVDRREYNRDRMRKIRASNPDQARIDRLHIQAFRQKRWKVKTINDNRWTRTTREPKNSMSY